MFYSPKKDIERYVTLKNHQIQNLKQQLESQKVSEENLQIARKKLDKIKNQYNILISENHHQLIDTLRKAQNKNKIVDEELTLKKKQLELKISEKNDLLDMRRQVLDKVQKAKQSLILKKTKQTQLITQRQSLDESVKKLISQNQKTRKQNDETQTLLSQAKKQLSQCKTKASQNQQKVQELKQTMSQVGSDILDQKERIGCMKAQQKMQQLKMQNLQMKIQYLLQVKSNLIEQKQKMNWNKLIFKERSQLNKHQSVSSQLTNCLLKVATAMKQNKVVQKEACQRQIKDKLIQLQLTECTQNQLRERIQTIQQKTIKVQQNTKQITNKLKNLQVQDSQIVSMLMKQNIQVNDKKVDDKKSVQKSRQNKQNVPLVQMNFKQSMWSKLNPLQLAKTCQDQSQINCQ